MSDDRRLLDCVKAWPDAESGMYDPRCCRFPKSCSPYPYDEQVALGNVELETASAPRPAGTYVLCGPPKGCTCPAVAWCCICEASERGRRLIAGLPCEPNCELCPTIVEAAGR